MSIAPPSDIVLDVARAADPTRYSEAAAKLRRVTTTPASGVAFDGLLDAYQAEDGGLAAEDALSDIQGAAERAVAAAPPASATRGKRDAFGAFEAMVLTNFVESMMPTDKASVFGGGTAGEVWASMLAEKIAGQIAESGGVGIADQLRTAQVGPQSGAVRREADASALDGGAVVSAMTATSQRSFLAALRPTPANVQANTSLF